MMCICRHRWATLNFDSLIPFAFRLSIFHFRSILDMCWCECEYQYYGAYFTVNTCSQIQWHTRLFSMIFLHICSEWMDRVAFKCTHNSHLQFECINFAQWAKSWMRYSNKEYGDRLGKTGWLQIQTEHTDTQTLNERKWEKRKRKTKNEKQKNV